MLNALRKGAGGWIAQLFIALLVVSFAVWGVSGFLTGFQGDTVATVGKTDVSAQQFFREYDLAKRRLGQQIGQAVTDEQARLFGIPGQVLGRLVTEATLNDEADTLGLGVSGETLATQIKDDPTFQGPTGSFDRNRFIQVINNAGMTEDQFVAELQKSYVRQQLASAVVGAMEPPDAYLRAFHDYLNEERSIAYLVLTPDQVGAVADPTETELTTFFNENKSDWRTPELRSVSVVRMTPEDMANTGDVSDEEAQKVYDSQLATRFTEPERRQVEQIVFKDMADATEAASALADGKTFDALKADRGLTDADVDLGLITRDKISDPDVAEAAFSLTEGSVSGIVEGRFGPVIVRVTAIEPEVVTSFEDAKAEIKQELAAARAAQEITDQFDVIEDARAGGATLQEIASNYGLKLVTYPGIDATGNNVDGVAIADLPGGNELVSAVFESDVGLENNAIPIEGGYVWYDVTAVSADRDRELSEVREKVITAFKTAKVDEKLTELAEQNRDRLARGDAIDDVATEIGVEPATADAIKRSTQASGALTAQAIQEAFNGPKGYAGVAPGADDAKIVLVVTDVTVPPYFSGAPEMAETEQRLSGDLTNDLLQQYIAQLQDRLGVSVNQATLQQLIGATDPGV
ncbi:peptidylprolyl isomerase [Bauldia litoralis]|uniref:Parvulin-like PPIase n=1 Tax=Bauldia litoralis TaxID=665467 RepID=A0A1G6AXP6_9HYPH|nr:peptidylprolyl isomerase [Bauldia litoralis]SDB13170.1 peptidyl-prolyl cis-trans isomerase D [Bauldia litoralis]